VSLPPKKKRKKESNIAMARQSRRSRTFLIPAITAILCLALTLSGCGYFGYYTRKAVLQTTFDNIPSMSALNQVRPEDSLVVAGSISKPPDRQEPLLLVAVSNKYRKNEKVVLLQLPATDNFYMAFLPKGEYELMIFADLDNNRDFEWNELVGRVTVNVDPGTSQNGTIFTGPTITADFDHPGKVDFHLSETVRPVSNRYASLENEFFDPKYGNMGLYSPTELIAHTQGFIFGLDDYEEGDTVVLFVHGISGTPRDWKFMVEGLDRKRFQPMFFYYPSGLPLDKLGTLLAQTISSLDKSWKQNGHRIILVAHSMGGLVALSAINKLAAEGLPPSLKMYCSFSTPYAGDENARKGIEIAPVVVPVWRDVAAKSEFLTDLISKPFPDRLPFYLYFSYLDTTKFKLGESSDGSVSLRSQLVPSLQSSATKILGFNETHVGILNSESPRQAFLQLLDTVTRGSALVMGE
jgi:pimeloyl-ACP methyl ester carboxylesterase